MTNTLETKNRPQQGLSTPTAWSLLILIFFAVQIGSLFPPALLDDADASHAQAAQHMAQSGDWVTLKVNGIRYLEKPPLPYWITAGLFRIFGENAFAARLPNALAILEAVAKQLGMTRSRLARKIDMDPGYLSRVAHGKDKASANLWLKINDLLEQGPRRGKGA